MLKYVLIALAAASIIYLVYVFWPRRRRTRDKTDSGYDGSPYYSDTSPSSHSGGKNCKESSHDNDSSSGDCGSDGGDGGGGDGGGD